MGEHATYYYAADVVAFCGDEVLLIDRLYEPTGKAFPGGHVDPDETSQQAAAREAREETGLRVDPDDLQLVAVYDDPDRDPRHRTISVCYWVEVTKDQAATVAAADDAAAVGWYHRIEAATGQHGQLVFDHDDMLHDAMAARHAADSIS